MRESLGSLLREMLELDQLVELRGCLAWSGSLSWSGSSLVSCLRSLGDWVTETALASDVDVVEQLKQGEGGESSLSLGVGYSPWWPA